MKRVFVVSLAAASTVLAGAAQAQVPAAWPEWRTTFQLQGFLPRTTSTVRVDDGFQGNTGTTASGEDDYGLPRDKPALGLAFMRRIGQNWRIDLEYLEQRRSAGNVRLRRDIQAYGGSYAAGTSVRTRLAFTSLRIAGGYTVLRQDAAEFGVSFGGVVSRYDVDVSGSGAVPLNSGHADAQASLGLYAASALSPTARLQARFEGGPGHRQLNAGASWRLAANTSVAANLRWMTASIAHTLSPYAFNTERAEFRWLGPQLSLEVGF